MCFVDRSLEQVTSVCTMCKVFPPRNNYTCPHKDSMGVCKNRTNHPRHDVLYFRNAELSFFNGCGFCKWAKRNPKMLAGDAAWRNPGWPGCCRPPKPQDYDLIAPTDWYAVSRIHGVPPPAAVASPPSPHMPMNKSPTHSPPSKNKPMPTGLRTPERRNSGSKDRGNHVASPPSSSSSSSGGIPSPSEGTHHRSNSDVSRRPDAPRSQSTPRDSTTRSPRTPVSPRKDHEGKYPQDDRERRTSTKTYNTATIRGPPPIFNPPLLPRPVNPPPPPKPAIIPTVPPPPPPSASSSSSSSCSSLAKSGTVTSEGFTDYLSDESEMEMQREAERRAVEAELAALLEKQRLETGREEQEFRAARIQLAAMGLQPPSAWSMGKTASGSTKSTENTHSSSQYGGNSRTSRPSSSEMYRSSASTQLMPVYPVRQ